jgi:hypothetical protein
MRQAVRLQKMPTNSPPCTTEEMSPTEIAIFEKIDEVIIEQAATLGWRIQESPTVRDRISMLKDR